MPVASFFPFCRVCKEPISNCLSATKLGLYKVRPLSFFSALLSVLWLAAIVLFCYAMLCVVGCGVVWYGVVWCGVVWRGVVWFGVVWCGLVWCGVVCVCVCVSFILNRNTGVVGGKLC